MTIRTFLSKYQPLRDADTGGSAGADAAAAATAAAAAAAAAKEPWHKGVDAETVGHWQNKGWKVEDPKEIAVAATKQARELEKHFGVPADQLLKLPKADARPEDVKAFHKRLGAPDDAKEYDFSTVKYKGQPLDANLDAAMRGALAQAFVPKDRAVGIAAAVAKSLESAETSAATVHAAKIAAEKTKLAENWKGNYDFNHLKAMEGVRRAGISIEAVQAMENQIGYAAVMEHFRKIGANTSEDAFIERGTTGGGVPHTREGAMSRKTELMADADWCGRFTKGGIAERDEMRRLNQMIDGEKAA